MGGKSKSTANSAEGSKHFQIAAKRYKGTCPKWKKEVTLDYWSTVLVGHKSPQLEMPSFTLQSKSLLYVKPIKENGFAPEKYMSLFLKGVGRHISWWTHWGPSAANPVGTATKCQHRNVKKRCFQKCQWGEPPRSSLVDTHQAGTLLLGTFCSSLPR